MWEPTSAWAGEGARMVPVSRIAEAMDTTRRRARRAAPVSRFRCRAEWGIGCAEGMETSLVKERGGSGWAAGPLPSGDGWGEGGGWRRPRGRGGEVVREGSNGRG